MHPPLPQPLQWMVCILLECILVTGCNEVVAKVMFLLMSVIPSTGGDGSPCKETLQKETPLARRPPGGRHPPGKETPLARRSPGNETPQQGDPPGKETPLGRGPFAPARRPPWEGGTPQGDPPPPHKETPQPGKETPRHTSMSSRYASYWNAFLSWFSFYIQV